MKIGLIGAGRLGICLALLMENAGYDVLVSDIREDYVENLNKKIISSTEPFVQEHLKQTKYLEATTDNKRVIQECDIIFTLVATPSLDDGSYDISSVWNVVRDFQETSDVEGKTLVVGCTTNPGDCVRFQEQLTSYGVSVVYNPEFIAQGSIIKDLTHADMVLIGGDDAEVLETLSEIYKKIQVTKPSISIMSSTAAEIVKIAVNCFMTTKISFANMIGEVLILSGLENEIESVLSSIASDSRIGSKYLNFGFGFGGPCLPRDNRSFGMYAERLGLKYNLGTTTDDFNNEHAKFLKNYFINKNVDSLPFHFDYISYKKGTDILTESQQYKLCLDLLDVGYEVYVSDNPHIIEQVEGLLTDQYGDRIIFGKPPEGIKTIAINL
jgi:nucleotide sugar dehydrogenase